MFFISLYDYKLLSNAFSFQPTGLPLAFLVGQVCSQESLLTFCLSGNVLSLRFLKDIFDVYRILHWQFFFHVFHHIWEIWGHCVFRYFFLCFSFSSPSKTPIMPMWVMLNGVPWVSEMLFMFLYSFFLSFSDFSFNFHCDF